MTSKTLDDLLIKHENEKEELMLKQSEELTEELSIRIKKQFFEYKMGRISKRPFLNLSKL
tara:strand:+ start:757 stop:936 length:180 start_codon:yes stop_codon:yes gene_type:complete